MATRTRGPRPGYHGRQGDAATGRGLARGRVGSGPPRKRQEQGPHEWSWEHTLINTNEWGATLTSPPPITPPSRTFLGIPGQEGGVFAHGWHRSGPGVVPSGSMGRRRGRGLVPGGRGLEESLVVLDLRLQSCHLGIQIFFIHCSNQRIRNVDHSGEEQRTRGRILRSGLRRWGDAREGSADSVEIRGAA